MYTYIYTYIHGGREHCVRKVAVLEGERIPQLTDELAAAKLKLQQEHVCVYICTYIHTYIHTLQIHYRVGMRTNCAFPERKYSLLRPR